jgi:hypothetical protein
MNYGLSEKLILAFPDIVAVKRPLVNCQEIADPNWLAGFTAVEGCFQVSIFKAKTKLGEAVKLFFNLTQNDRDEILMRSLVKYLGYGGVCKDRNSYKYDVTKFSDINKKIIPFFQKHPIQGVKVKDFDD